eukprot:gene5402-65526_t
MNLLEYDLEAEHRADGEQVVEELLAGGAQFGKYHMEKLEEDGICSFPRNDTDPHWNFIGA